MVVELMPKRLLSEKLDFNTRSALVNIFLLTNALVWYSSAIVVLQGSIEALELEFIPNLLVWSTHFSALIFSALAGGFFTRRLGGRIRFLTVWIIVGTIASLVPLVINTTEVWGVVTVGLVYGLSLGFGMPNCVGYFTNQISIENRGRIAGLTILLTGVGMVGFDLVAISYITLQVVILAVWRAVALVSIALIKPTTEIEKEKGSPSYRAVLHQRSFVLYFIPWIMFSLLNYLTTPVQQNVLDSSVIYDLQLIGNILLAAFALVGGILMDFLGRKRMAIIGFVMLGLSYSILGFFRETSMWYIHTIMNGISWGILYVLFVVVIWGDLSYGAPSDKYYALGVSPFFISKFLQLTINAQIIEAIDVSAIFSFTAFFLFLAVLPLIYAPETLPEKTMRDRELKNYIEKAKKEAEKAQQKEEESTQSENEDAEVEFQVNQEDYEEALKEAEKYY